MQRDDVDTILCPVDESDGSKGSLYTAAGLAFRPNSRLVVLHATGSDAPRGDAAVRSRLRIEELVRKALPASRVYSQQTEILLVGGKPSDAILAAGKELNASLIVMGTRGRGPLTRALLGSTAANVLRRTDRPVAVVPPAAPEITWLDDAAKGSPRLGIVLVPLDIAAPSRNQLEWVGRISGASAHRLFMMTVVPPGSDLEGANLRLKGLAESVDTAHGSRLLVREGDTLKQVIRVIEHDNISVTVLGRDAEAPGDLAYELLRQTSAVVVVVP